MTEFSTLGIAFNLLLFIICYNKLHKAWFAPDSVSKGDIKLCYFLCFLFFLMPFYGGDYYSYRKYFESISNGNLFDTGSFEDIYIFIAQHSFGIYTIFRLIIWGTAMALIILTGKNLRLKSDLFLLLLSCCFITALAYARVTLSMALIFYGATKVNSKGVLNSVIGIIIIFIAYFFHKSALFGIGMIVVAFLATKLGRWSFIAFLILIPLILSFLVYLTGDFFTTSIAGEYVNINSAQGYLTDEQNEIGMGAFLLAILQRGPYYYISLIFISAVIRNQYKKWPKFIKIFGASVFLITVTASLFMLDFGLNTYTLYYRFLTFAAIPSICFMCFLRTKNIYPGLLKLSYWSLTLSVAYHISYTLYLSIVK